MSNMKHRLNYSKEDPKYILLEKIFKIIGSRKSKTIIASKGVKKIKKIIYSTKIFLTAIYLYHSRIPCYRTKKR